MPKVKDTKIKKYEPKESHNKLKYNQNSVQILLEEFKHIHDLYLRQRIKRNERVNFYVGIVTAIGAGLIIATQSKIFDKLILTYISICSLSLLGIFGILIQGNLIGNDIMSDNYIRGLNKIKKYFTDRDNEISQYLIFPPVDEPVLLNLRPSSILIIVQFFICTIFSTLAILFQYLISSQITFIQGLISVIIVFCVIITILYWWNKGALKKAAAKYKISKDKINLNPK